MSHIHWVERQNKLEIPKEKDEVNKREVHECDVRTRDPDAMVVPPTPKPAFARRHNITKFIVYYESIKREPKIIVVPNFQITSLIFFFHLSRMATYQREEVERVILAFYNGQNVVEANAWLTSFVASQVR
jgi:hypothetical protein